MVLTNIFKNALFSGGAFTFSSLALLSSLAFLSLAWKPDVLGFYFLLNALGGVWAISDFGINQTVIQKVSHYQAYSKKSDAQSLYSITTLFYLALSALVCVLVFIAYKSHTFFWDSDLETFANLEELLLVTCLRFSAFNLWSNQLAYLKGFSLFKEAGLMTTLLYGLGQILLPIVTFSFDLTLLQFQILSVLIHCFCLLAGVLYLRKLTFIRYKIIDFNCGRRLVKDVIKGAKFVFCSNSINSLLTIILRAFVSMMYGLETLSSFTIAYTLTSKFSQFLSAISETMIPVEANAAIKRIDKADLKKKVLLYFFSLVLLTVVAYFASLVIMERFIEARYSREFFEILRLQVLSFIPFGILFPLINFNIGRGTPWYCCYALVFLIISISVALPVLNIMAVSFYVFQILLLTSQTLTATMLVYLSLKDDK